MTNASGQNVPPPPSNLGLSLVVLVLFFPLGIPATAKSLQVPRLWRHGRHTEALEAAAAAKKRAIWGIVLLILVLVAFAALRTVPYYT